MTHRVLLIDLENVQTVDLSLIPSDARVLVFYGHNQKNLPEALVIQAHSFGDRFKWVKIAGQGPNALDFHIAFYLGQEFASHPGSECVIFSRDKGFDPLLRHLHALGHRCRRVQSSKETFATQAPATDEADFDRLLTQLRQAKVRPVRRKGIEGVVRSWFPKLPPEIRLALVQRLFDESRVRESEEGLMYDL